MTCGHEIVVGDACQQCGVSMSAVRAFEARRHRVKKSPAPEIEPGTVRLALPDRRKAIEGLVMILAEQEVTYASDVEALLAELKATVDAADDAARAVQELTDRLVAFDERCGLGDVTGAVNALRSWIATV